MHRVTDEQVDFILDDLKAHGVVLEDLQDNLLDHICCIIESEMNDDDDFYKFYERILPRFFKKELKEIQEETDNLLRFKHYYAMKKTLKITGMGSSILMLLGAIFKMMHWPGAGIMIVLGAATFSLIFLPLMIVLKFKDEEKTVDKITFAFSFILGMMAVMGSLFKVMHWPMANMLMISSTTLFIFAYIPLYFVTRYRRAELRFNTAINSVLMLGFGCMIFALINLSGSKNISDSVNASYTFMVNNAEKLQKANLELFETQDSKSSEEVRIATEKLNTQIEDTKAFLISIVNNIEMKDAYGLDILELKNPNAYLSFKDKFENGTGQYSLQALESAVNEYNQVMGKHYPEDSSKRIMIEELQLDRTILSMVLYELVQIQWQVAQNENAGLYQIAMK